MRASWFSILAVVGLITCGGDSPTETAGGFAGTWNLRTLGSTSVPITCVPINCPAYAQIGNLGIRVDVLGSTLTILDSGTWSETLDVSAVTSTGTLRQLRTIYGTYVRERSLIHLAAAADPAYLDCEIISGTLTCDDGRVSYAR